jgi:hypothetical protein
MCGQLHHTTPGRGVRSPPHVPRPAEEQLDLAVELLRRCRIALLEPDRRVRVHVGEPVHERHDVRALHGWRARAREDVAIAGGVDHHPAQDRLPAGLGLHDHPAHRVALHEGTREPRVKAEMDAGFERHLLRHLLPALGVEGTAVHDRLRLRPRVQLLESPPHPAVSHVRVIAEAVFHRRHHARADPPHPVDDLERQPPDGDLALGA